MGHTGDDRERLSEPVRPVSPGRSSFASANNHGSVLFPGDLMGSLEMTKPPPEIEDFLANLPEPARRSLIQLREDIRRATPEATEKIGYGVPAFSYLGRPLVSYVAGKQHCAFYVQSPAVMDAHAADLEGYRTSKGSVHFAPGTVLPSDLVAKLVRARMGETEAAARKT